MLQGVYRTVLFYGVLILVVRLMGKRQIGQMEPSEFVVTMLVANLAAIPLEELDLPLHTGLLPIGVVLVLEFILSWASLKSIKLRKFLCGKPVILVENGNILQRNLKEVRISLDELTAMLRLKDVLDLKQVRYAILETNGNLSVFLCPQEKEGSLPVTLVSDGRLLTENLKAAGKDRAWTEKVLHGKGVSIKDTYLLTVDGKGKIVFYKKEQPTGGQ